MSKVKIGCDLCHFLTFNSGLPNLFYLGYGRGQSIGLSLLDSQGRIPYDHRVDAQRKGSIQSPFGLRHTIIAKSSDDHPEEEWRTCRAMAIICTIGITTGLILLAANRPHAI